MLFVIALIFVLVNNVVGFSLGDQVCSFCLFSLKILMLLIYYTVAPDLYCL